MKSYCLKHRFDLMVAIGSPPHYVEHPVNFGKGWKLQNREQWRQVPFCPGPFSGGGLTLSLGLSVEAGFDAGRLRRLD